ncbi:MAG: hypothetical protein ACKVU0_05805 [Saprospiraceae bacterium]
MPSCQFTSKEPQYKPAAGRVLEYGTLTPIEGASVSLYDCEGELLGNFSCHILDSTLSDSEGRYAFSQTGFLTNARKDGYFTDHTTEAQVLFGSEDKTDIILPPHAWLRVTIRNESGVYGFGSSQLLEERLIQAQGQEHTVVKLVKGNALYNLIFFILLDDNTSTTDISNIKVLDESGNELPITQGVSLSVFASPIGHDTTNLFITY